MVELIRSDIEFMLEQIKRAEQGLGPDNPGLPQGIRTVDGRGNNVIPGQGNYGAADQPFPRATTPLWRPGEMFDPDGPGPAPAVPTSYTQPNGIVADSQPRIISNLTVDQTSNNPAAVAAFVDAGLGSIRQSDGALLDENGDVIPPGTLLMIPNVTPDAGLSAPFNSWFTLFGQFFDHGLDLVNKGGSGTVFIPLKPDDPLYDEGPDGVAGTPDDAPTNFMVLTRATNQPGPDGQLGTADDIREHNNQTTPFVDQNQTYTSHPSHQAFLRTYELDANGKPQATGELLEGRDAGADGVYFTADDTGIDGLAQWAVVKANAAKFLGIELTDADVTNVPLIRTDEYGQFIRGPNGFALLVTGLGPDGKPNTADDVTVEGNPLNPISTANAVRINHAFLDDIAHSAAPRGSNGAMLTPDTDTVAGVDDNQAGTYDNELLEAHYATGDGRGNENIGLTSVHHVFHSEHNRLVEEVKDLVRTALAEGDTTFAQEWVKPGTDLSNGIQDGEWNGERLFQTARFGTEMQYQHLVFEEFARKVQPNVNIFDAYETEINPAIVAEFAHTVYRFGHSMLTETVDRVDANGNPVLADTNDDGVIDGQDEQMGLIEAFLNPLAFAERGGNGVAAGEIVRGMTRQVGNEIDEFVTEALRNNLLGLPLDLATINLARGRDTGVPSFNAARREFFAGTDGDTALKPYESWVDFGLGLRNPESLINFIAAYGTHSSITNAETTAEKRAAATAIALGGSDAPADSVAFLNSTGAWASGANGVTTTGLDAVDLWIGGLAEKPAPFGGLLGSTFNFVFETQMEKLQNGDRFYYLSRTLGMNFFTELEQSTFSELVMRNTGAKHLPADVFSTPTYTIEVSDPSTWPAGQVIEEPNGTVRYTGEDHVVMGGTENNDRIRAGEGDDTIWGDGGDDVVEGGAGNDSLFGGNGNDIITDTFGDDVIQGNDGNDTINAGPGLDLILGGKGDDYIVGGEDLKEVFSGQGNDIIVLGDDTDEVRANEGDDWIEGGGSGDLLIGDNDHPLGLSTIIGHDVFIGGSGTDRMEGENGDDIFVGGEGLDRHVGSTGFDWMSYGLDAFGVTADLTIRAEVVLPPTPSPDALLDRFTEVEGLSGSTFNDVLRGDDEIGNTNANLGLINGLSALLGNATSFSGGNIILGGDGDDIIEGRGGDDFIDGDAHLNVRLTARQAGGQIIREIVTLPTAANDIDTVVFSEALANYTRTNNADGSITISHTGGSQADGTDTVTRVERLQFADQTVVVSGANQPASGTINISDTTPAEDQLLTATAAFSDPDGFNPNNVVYTWQAEVAGNWVDRGNGLTYQPGDADVGLQLRVQAVFQDSIGGAEIRFSSPTAAVTNVNDAPTGAPELTDTSPTEGQSLSASVGTIADVDGFTGTNVTYQWQVFNGTTWADIANAIFATFTPAQAQVNQPIRVVVSYTDGQGALESVASAATTVVGDQFIGSSSGVITTLTAGDDNASANAGNDTLNGLAGNDLLNGGAGNDIIDGGTGADTMAGGTNNDTYVVDDVGDVVTEFANQGTDTVQTSLNTYTLGANVENLVFRGTGSFDGIGNNLVNRIEGYTGADTLDGGIGGDTLVGGLGHDTYILDNVLDRITELSGTGTGLDVAISTMTTAGSATPYVLGNNVETLHYIGGGATHVRGNSSHNTLIGNGGNDWFDGNTGNDTIEGGGGADTLIGNSGNDILNGGAGDDILTGGVGNDFFVFQDGFGNDRIQSLTNTVDFDFNPTGGQDKLDISDLGITAATFAGSVAIAQSGADTLVTIGTDTITLVGVLAGNITQTDFLLA